MASRAELLSGVRHRARSGEARQIRLNALLSLEDVGREIGKDQSTVGRWERGERTPTGDAAIRYGRLLERLVVGKPKEAAS